MLACSHTKFRGAAIWKGKRLFPHMGSFGKPWSSFDLCLCLSNLQFPQSCVGDMAGKCHCLSSDGGLAEQTSPRVNCFASYFSTCSALNVCKRPSGSSPSPKMLPSGPVSSGSVEKSCELTAKVRIYRKWCAPMFLQQLTS